MLNRLQIKNFRLNKKLDVELDKITTFRGANGRGKSSLVYALKWVMDNRPKGDRFISWGEDNSAVKLSIDNHTLIRKKSKKQNYYKLNGNVYKAFGIDVPDPVKAILKMSDINFQHQHDRHFWFSETAGEVNKQLNEIVNLEIIDKTSANLSKQIRDNKVKCDDTKERLREAIKEKKELKYILTLDKELKALEEQETHIQKVTLHALKLTNYTNLVSKYALARDNSLNRATEANFVIQKGKTATKISNNCKNLSDLIKEAENYKKIKDIKIPSLQRAIITYEKYKTYEKKTNRLFELSFQANGNREIVLLCKENIKAKNKKFTKLMGDRCPLCQQKIQ